MGIQTVYTNITPTCFAGLQSPLHNMYDYKSIKCIYISARQTQTVQHGCYINDVNARTNKLIIQVYIFEYIHIESPRGLFLTQVMNEVSLCALRVHTMRRWRHSLPNDNKQLIIFAFTHALGKFTCGVSSLESPMERPILLFRPLLSSRLRHYTGLISF